MKNLSKILILMVLGLSIGMGLSIGCTTIKDSKKQKEMTSLDYAERIRAQSCTILKLICENNDLKQKILRNSQASENDMLFYEKSTEDINDKLVGITELMEANIYELMEANIKLKQISTSPL